MAFLPFSRGGCGSTASDGTASDGPTANAERSHSSDTEASDDTGHTGGSAAKEAPDPPGVSDDSTSAPCTCAEGEYFVRLAYNGVEQLFDQPIPRAYLDAGYYLFDRALFDQCSSVAQPSMHLGGSCRGDEVFACDSEGNCIVMLDDGLFVTDKNGTAILSVEFATLPARQDRFPSEQNTWRYTAPSGITYEVEFKACVIEADLCLR